ncbi:MAG: hypothetical protein FJ224_06605 [Lentisphaerae bacterium]|nr:hypothetical protein [Lentisphaerota bacterium]
MSRQQVRLALFVMVLLAVASAGCRRPWRRGAAADPDFLQTTALGEQDIPLGERMADGIPVADFTAANVQFAYDSFQVAPTEAPKVESVADYMRRNGDVRLVIEGHCDERGSREYNMALGEHRALAVRAYLVGLGIDAQRVQTRSLGEESPIDPGHDERAWWFNRRAEFKLFR